MSVVSRNGTTAYIGLPEREATKLQDLWQRDEVGVELSVEVKAPVVVGVYPMRIARFVLDQANGGNGHHAHPSAATHAHLPPQASTNGQGNGMQPPADSPPHPSPSAAEDAPAE